MRILMVTSDFPPDIGGVAAHVYELSKALIALGHQVVVASVWLDERRGVVETVDGIELHRVAGIYKIWPFTFKCRRYRLRQCVKQLVKLYDFDVIHIHGHAWEAYATRFLAHKIPIVGTMHSSGFIKKVLNEKSRKKLKKRLVYLSRIITPSSKRCEIADQLNLSAGKSFFIPNGVNTKRFIPNINIGEFLQEIQFKKKTQKIVLCACRLAPVKGVIYLVRAIPSILEIVPNILFVFAGSERPQYGQEIRKFIHQAEIADHCLFLGNFPNTDMPQLMKLADVSVLPSLMEATSVTCLESMAMSMPIIGTQVDGLLELIDHERHGLLVPPGNSSALAKAILRILTDSELACQLGKSARERVLKEFDWINIAKKVQEIYYKARN